MSRVSDLVVDLKIIAEGIDKFLRWASRSALKRFLTFSLAGAAVTAGYYWHTDSLLEEVRANNQKSMKEAALWGDTNRYKSVLDWAQLCLSKQENDENGGWYCEQALNLYEARSDKSPPELRKNIIEKKAYGGIVIDMSNQLRGAELSRLHRESPSAAEETLDRLLSDVGTALLVIFLFLSMSLIWALLLKYAKQPDDVVPPAESG